MIKLMAIYSLWNGVLKMIEGIGLDKKICSILKPITKKLFPDANEKALKQIGMNLTSNFLGLGGAGTTTGIKAITEMDNGYATRSILLFFIINVTSIQLLPTTVIALRADANSQAPSDIFLPSLIATSFTTILGIVGVLFFEKVTSLIKSARLKGKKDIQ